MINKENKNLEKLILDAVDYLKSQSGFAKSTIDRYRNCWKRLKKVMDFKGIKYYDQIVEMQILNQEFGNRTKRELSDNDQYFLIAVKRLTEFQITGKIKNCDKLLSKPLVFSGEIGRIIEMFLDFKSTEVRLSVSRIRYYKQFLCHFLSYCNANNIYKITDVNSVVILQYVAQLGNDVQIPNKLSVLSSFLRHIYQQAYLDVDYSKKVPRYKRINQPKLPSVYSTQEIEKLISSVERSSRIGKRNYAIILLAARLGLRASDIANLQFNNLHWDTSTLELKQVKTGKNLVLPLLLDVGNAIIEYLKYGRPESQEPYLFLKATPPYKHFPDSGCVTKVVQRAFRNTDIYIRERKFGAHSLRHTLGFRMLEESTILPVISEVLGHANSESTRYYLRVDLKSMRQCTLDVPLVAKEFYQQKGGVFYEK
jgi:integrase